MRTQPNVLILRFFLLTLLLSWGIWIPLAVAGVNVRAAPWFYIMAIGGASPSVVGVLFIIRSRIYTRTEFVRSLLSLRSIGVLNFVLMTLAIAVPFVVSLAVDYAIWGNAPSSARFISGLNSPLAVLLVVLSLVYGGPLTEEFGWRGFAARLLQPGLGVLKTGVLIGAIWSVWHYPLLFLNGQYQIDNYFVYIPVHMLKHIALSVVIAYFFQATNRSVLAAMYIHFLSNALVNLFYPIPLAANAVHCLLLMIVAGVLVALAPADSTPQRGRRSPSSVPRVQPPPAN